MSRPLILFTDETDLDPTPGRALLEQAGCDTLLAALPSNAGRTQELPEGAERAVALIVGYARIDASLLDRLPHVECIATMSAGTDMIDLETCRSRGIWVVNLVDAATEEVAAHALLLMLALERSLPECLSVTARGGWTDEVVSVPRRLSELTLGLFGFGRIARRFAEIAAPVVGRVVAYDPYAAAAVGSAELVGLDQLLAESDVLSLHSPLTPETEGVIDEAVFVAMRQGASLINVARGELVNYPALRAALDSGKLRGAALDVLQGEPPSVDDPLRHEARVLVTPHVAFLSEGSLERYTLDPARNVLNWLRSGRLDHAVVRGEARVPLR